jgi:predicted nucleic-acid-binding protein
VIGLDTNVLIHAMTQDDEVRSPVAARVLRGLTTDDPGFVSTVVFAETYRVLTRSYRMDRGEAALLLAHLATTEGVVAEAPLAVEAAGIAAQRGFDFADSLIAFATRRAGCSKTVTFDRKASMQPGWELL